MSRTSHNVGSVYAIEGKAERYKGNLTIPMSVFGDSYSKIKGGGSDMQGGLVFKKEEIALQLLNTLQEYFKKPMTVRKEVSSWYLNRVHNIKLWIEVWFMQRRTRKKLQKNKLGGK